MYSYLARQPIVDIAHNLFGYELLFRDGENNCFPDIDPDEATSKLLTQSHLTTGVEVIANGKWAFINFHDDTLIHRFPTSLDPKKVIIEIVETVALCADLLEACKSINEQGYKMALDDYDFSSKWDALLPYVHFIKVDITEHPLQDIVANMGKLKASGVKLVAERIETKEEFECFRDMGFHYFQGYFFAKPEMIKHKIIPSSKLTLLQLITVSSRASFDFDEINHIIEKDVALSYKLLRFINGPKVNKRNKILSLRHALNYMGAIEFKKFIALLALANLAESKPDELANMSLVRAKFCELLSSARADPKNPPCGFLVGLFSLLDTLLDQTMQDLMAKLPLNEELVAALCGKENNLSDYLKLVCAFEHSRWDEIAQASVNLEVHQDVLFSIYQQAVIWGASMMQDIKVA
ncbi:MAG: EAL and modified HD-GYP domain-containing signal transduction protein [Paraglaciecola sp.]|jgi:EAL and modified HD-GYP domain-containing signal transduction protein